MNAENLLNAQIILFFGLYIMRTLLITGYDNLKYLNGKVPLKNFFKDFIKYFFSSTPLIQKRLEPRGYDHKMYIRFQKRFGLYYFALWILLFSILFFAAKIYLNAFS